MGGVFCMYLDKKIKELKELQKEVPNQAIRIVNDNKQNILDLIRDKQLFDKGIDGTGKKLKAYSPFTVAIKRQKGEPADRTTLADTGAFYDGFDLLVTDQLSIGVFSRDSKTPKLIEKYGSDIFTFTVENNEIINEDIVLKGLTEWLLQTKTFTEI